MQYRSKPTQVEAVQWKSDNLDEFQNTFPTLSFNVATEEKNEDQILHVTTSFDFRIFLCFGEYLVQDQDTGLETMSEEEFNEKFEPVTSQWVGPIQTISE